MIQQLRSPLTWPRLAALLVAVTLLNALYCVAYTTLSGRPTTLADALAWGLVNLVPWIAAVELGKRPRMVGQVALLLLAMLIVSLGLGAAMAGSGFNLPFEAVRRLPGLLVATAALLLLRSSIGRPKVAEPEISLLPRQIDWVRAAGNYVELRGCGRTVVHRASLSALEAELRNHGFIRIHRSMLVRRERIARVRPADVVLVDGTSLKVGKRYRAALAA